MLPVNSFFDGHRAGTLEDEAVFGHARVRVAPRPRGSGNDLRMQLTRIEPPGRETVSDRLQIGDRGAYCLIVAFGAPGLEAFDLQRFHCRVDHHDGAFTGSERRGFGLGPLVDTDDGQVTLLDEADALGVARRGETTRLGRILGPLGVRYVAVPLRPARAVRPERCR